MSVATAMTNKELSACIGSERKRVHGQRQKSAGMVWGSNSPFNRHKNTQVNSSFGDFGKYMVEKKRKLSLQYQAEACDKSVSTSCADTASTCCNTEHSINTNGIKTANLCNDSAKLFAGISIFVDGFTTPSHQELRDLMLKYGGMFQNYFSRALVTHIVCSNLPDSKIKDHRSFSKGLPIVKPTWILDSISSGRVLPTCLYAHERIQYSHPNQLTVSRFFDSRKGDIKSHHQEAEKIICTHENMPSKEQQGTASCDVVLDTMQSKLAQGFAQPKLDLEISVSLNTLDDKATSPILEPVRSHCASEDANFVQNYFKNSRLHFIGTWRTRYHHRFHGSMMENNQEMEKTNLVSDDGDRLVMHVDMDCFFVSVVVRDRPELIGQPVVVCHSENTHGTAEISSANYAARAYGIRSGMFIRNAKALCPQLVVVPYDFEGYEQVADQFYDVLHKHCKKVQAVSCDEAYLDVTGSKDPEELATQIRKEVFCLTRCTASIGVAENLLLARMATRKAKPDGQFRIIPCHVEGFLSELPVEDLPGVGWSLQERLHSKGIYNCKQLQGFSKEILQHEFGAKTGDMLWCFARGIDKREVKVNQVRKSIGAEVNWGVRFNAASEAQHFLTTLCEEVSARLQNALVAGRTFTLKIKRKKEGATEPAKFMGCGSCYNLSKSVTLGCATNNVEVILRVSRQIFTSFHLDVCEIRGMGLQVTRLESKMTSHIDGGRDNDFSFYGEAQIKKFYSGHHHQELEACLKSISSHISRETRVDNENFDHESNNISSCEIGHPSHVPIDDSAQWGFEQKECKEKKGIQILGKVRKGPFTDNKHLRFLRQKKKQNFNFLPHHIELDWTVLASLPPDIIAELDDAYNGAVSKHLLSMHKPENGGCSMTTNEPPVRYQSFPVSVEKGSCMPDEKPQKAVLENMRILPSSLSQVDMATLDELPVELRTDILQSFSMHYSSDPGSVSKLETLATTDIRELIVPLGVSSDLSSNYQDFIQLDDLWDGDPPKWVVLFETIQGIGTNVLHLLSKSFFENGCTKQFSGILLHAMCSLNLVVFRDVEWDMTGMVAFRCCLELFKQYILSNVSCNLEEVFTALRVLKRLSRADQFWEKLFNTIIPFIQESSREVYGATVA